MAEMNQHDAHGSEELARSTLDDGHHLVQAVAGMSEKHGLTAHEDIYSRQGVKLVSRGARLDARVAGRLLQHKLLKPVEQSLTLENNLTPETLAQAVGELIAECELLLPLRNDGIRAREVQGIFASLPLPAPLALKLMVARSERPALFRHCLLVAILAVWLGHRRRLSQESLRLLALSGTLHDIGELHIDPSIMHPEHDMTHEERRHLYAHPITGFMMLCQQREIPHAAALIVLQHQERLDGSGYPYRLVDPDISVLTRYVALADVAASVLERTGSAASLCVLLRLNRNKYDPELIGVVGELFRDWGTVAEFAVNEAELMMRLIQSGKLFETWDALYPAMQQAGATGEWDFLHLRMDAVRVALTQAGFDQASHESLLALTSDGDPEVRAELGVLFSELKWQLRAVSREIERVRHAGNQDGAGQWQRQFKDWLEALHEFVGED